ncbi:MAG TPA: citrate synthase/methylcitrate synthase [Thermoanaerobaculia bacterium]|jgi:citrate synthase|nr:citrate synthase/methylcitrate synthase [Thermoanaerobaculia bacterium]
MKTDVQSGLEGVVAAETRLSMVDGERGELVIGGFRVEDLASWTFEDTVELLWAAAGFHGRPQAMALPDRTARLLRDVTGQNGMDALRMAAGTLIANDDASAAQVLVGTFPTIVAAHWRLQHGQEPITPRTDLGIAANYLYMLTGTEPHEELVRGMETYLNTVVDHGLNASTFTARVIASTGSDFVSAITGAVGALKGPLHGGAPGPALDMVFEIGDVARAEDVLRRKIDAGERLMGFGHRVYKVRDPRADVLAAAAERMFHRAGDMRLYELARGVEATALRLLEEHKPGRRLQTNVEFYTALLLHGLGLEVPLFTPTFAISRVAGWTAHCFEQRRVGKLIRPQSIYAGLMPA